METIQVVTELNSHIDSERAVSCGSWPSPSAFVRADYASYEWFRCIARQHWCFEC